MLPINIEEDETYKFVVNRERSLCIVFARPEMTIVNGPVEALWHREAADERSLRALIRWAGVRRARWQDWGRLAEEIGREAFYQHMRDLMATEPPAECTGTVVQREDDPQEIVMGEMMHGAAGIHVEELYRHRFPSSAARDAFYDWFCTGRNCDLAADLLQIGFSQGTAALGEVLNEIAAGPLGRAERRCRAKTATRVA
jgi:hypothetical protein